MDSEGRDQSRAQVALARLPDRKLKEDAIEQAIQEVLAPLGGLPRFVSPGAKVLLKPNQTLFRAALSGSTTSPRLVRALIRLCFRAGAKEVWVAEASGHAPAQPPGDGAHRDGAGGERDRGAPDLPG